MAEHLLSNTAGSLQMAKKLLTLGNTAPTFWRHQFCKTRVSHTGIDEDSRLLWYNALSAGKYCSYWYFGGSCCLYLLVLSLSSQLFLKSLDSDPEEGGSQLIQNVIIYQVAWCHITDDLTVHQFCLYRHTNLSNMLQIQCRNYVWENCDPWKSCILDANNLVVFKLIVKWELNTTSSTTWYYVNCYMNMKRSFK